MIFLRFPWVSYSEYVSIAIVHLWFDDQGQLFGGHGEGEVWRCNCSPSHSRGAFCEERIDQPGFQGGCDDLTCHPLRSMLDSRWCFQGQEPWKQRSPHPPPHWPLWCYTTLKLLSTSPCQERVRSDLKIFNLLTIGRWSFQEGRGTDSDWWGSCSRFWSCSPPPWRWRWRWR